MPPNQQKKRRQGLNGLNGDAKTLEMEIAAPVAGPGVNIVEIIKRWIQHNKSTQTAIGIGEAARHQVDFL